MALAGGTRLGSYEVLSPLGAGGMGEVYRAHDTRLGRDVAVKILPSPFAVDPERVARFDREAQLLAALNHPHIAAIYGLEESGPVKFLVLELVDGESLDHKLRRGSRPIGDSTTRGSRLPVAEALNIARQIVDALEAAHDKGIVHRDLKPANIMLTSDGEVKVLDFGLAKLDAASASVSGERGELTHSPTLTYAATQAGMILGTAPYMSPEQAKGRAADKRSDVWAFGCVLYEMLAGRRAFDGEDVTDIVAAVVRAEPDWTALPADVPPHIRTLVMRCLDKDRKTRIGDIAVARFLVDEGSAISAAASGPTDGKRVDPSRSRLYRALPWAVAGIALALAGLLAASGGLRRAERPAPPVRLSAEIGGDLSLDMEQGPAVNLSPDGSLLVIVARKSGEPGRLYVRPLGQLQATPLAGTEDARASFFSPDGKWIAFFAAGKLKKISVTGGAPITVCDVPNARGGAWAADDTIVFLPSPGASVSLHRVPAAGGTPEVLVPAREGEVSQRWPQMLPNGKAVLYTTTRNPGSYDDGAIIAQPLPNGERKMLVRGGYFGRYLPSGHLTYMHQGTLFAVAMDQDRLETVGQPIPLVEHMAGNAGIGFGQFAVSSADTIAYVSGEAGAAASPILWLDRSGQTSVLRPAAADWSNIRFSPDGQRLAVDVFDGNKNDIYVYDWARDTLTRLTVDASDNQKPAWTPDGRRIAFRSNREGSPNLYWQRADGVGDAQRLTNNQSLQMPGSWHPSGKFLAFSDASASSGAIDLMILPLDGNEASGWKPGKPFVFVKGPPGASDAAFSPDGRWIAYFSLGPAAPEVFVQPFPGPGGKRQISSGGGIHPTWSRSGRELFFESLDQQIMVVPYSVDGDSFNPDKPRRWSDVRLNTRPRGFVSVSGRAYDVHPDGMRIAGAVVPPSEGTSKLDHVVLVFNFAEELKRIAPGRQ